MIIAITGHRPNKLWGYNLDNLKYQQLHDHLYQLLQEYNPTHCISGMALGTDTIFAIAVLRYKQHNPDKNIKLECAIPCRDYSSKWSEKDKKLYQTIIKQVDIVTLVSDEEYKPYLMQKRNEYMVNKCDLLLAVWDGNEQGGTYNCVQYAKKQGKDIKIINPHELTCQYCQPPSTTCWDDLGVNLLGDDDGIHIAINSEGYLEASVSMYIGDHNITTPERHVKLNYCPVCGRKLD